MDCRGRSQNTPPPRMQTNPPNTKKTRQLFDLQRVFFLIYSTLWRWSRQLAPPFMSTVVVISQELPIISLSSKRNEGSLETWLSHTEISLSQWAVSAPIMLAFLILCYYYPQLQFSLQRIKHWGFQDPHNNTVRLLAIGQTMPPRFSYIGNLYVVGVWLCMSKCVCNTGG